MVDPRKADEVVIDAASAKALGYHVGEEIPVGWVTNAQTSSGNFNPNQPIPVHQRARVKLVGIAGGQATTLFQDQDNANGQSIMLFTPALTNKLLACCSNDMVSALTLQGGDRHLSAVEAAVKRALPKGLPFVYAGVTEHHRDRQRHAAPGDDRTQCLRRHHRDRRPAHRGAGDQSPGPPAGTGPRHRPGPRSGPPDVPVGQPPRLARRPAARFVARRRGGRGLSRHSGRSGPVRPFLGVALHPDWAVIGIGVLTLVLVLGGVAVLASFRSLPDRARNRAGRFTSSRVTTAATRAGLPPSAVTGVRFALEPGVGRSAVPVRSAILGAILAVTVVVATVTFGSSLNTLVSHPALYGWNWNYDMDGGGGLGDIPGQAAAKLLDADPLVQSWTGVYYSTLTFDGVNVPVMGATPGAAVAPPLLSGHGLQASNQVVLGASTLRSLHKQLGDTVQVRIHGSKPVTLTIVGTATLPPIGVVGSSHLEMGTGAVLSYRIIPARGTEPLRGHSPGRTPSWCARRGGTAAPRWRRCSPSGAGWTSPSTAAPCSGWSVPAEILNYGSLGTTPLLLGAALAVGAAAALGITCERLTGVAYQLGWKVICRFPLSWARWVFAAVADIAWRRQGPKVQVLEANLRARC